eukprot:1149150-Pelagomonas_calceolata.AAC.1
MRHVSPRNRRPPCSEEEMNRKPVKVRKAITVKRNICYCHFEGFCRRKKRYEGREKKGFCDLKCPGILRFYQHDGIAQDPQM